MANYGDLKADIAAELARNDLSTVIPRFVRQATQRINRDERLRTSETQRRARSAGNTTRYLACPDDFLEMRRLWNVIQTGGVSATTERRRDTIIEQVAPQDLPVLASPGGRLPRFFSTSRGDPPEIEFDVPLADDREVEMLYCIRYAEFSADSDSNWLLDTHYDVYFRASLAEAELYLRNDERAAVWAGAYDRAANEVHKAQRRRDYIQTQAARPTQPVF